MKRSERAGIFGLALVFLIALAGCKQPTLSTDATLKGISIAGVAVTSMGTPSSDWKSVTAGAVTISNAASLNVPVNATLSDGGAYVYLALAQGAAEPNFVSASSFSAISDGDFVYIEVFSQNRSDLLFYKIQVSVAANSPVLMDVTLAGRSATGYTTSVANPVQQFGTGLGTPAATWNAASIVAGSIWFGTSQANTALAVVPTPMLTGTTTAPAVTFQYAVAPDATTAPTFAASANVTVADGNYLYVQATLVATPNTVLIYKLKLVQKHDDRTLSGVTITNGTITTTMDIGAMGTNSFPGAENFGSYTNGAQLAKNGTNGNNGVFTTPDDVNGLNSVTIAATPTDSTTTVQYDEASVASGLLDYLVFAHSPRTDNTTGVFTGTTKLVSGQYLAVQVTSQIGEKGWYAFRVAAGQSDTTVTGLTIDGTAGTVGPLTTFYGYWFQGTPGAITLPASTTTLTVAPTLATTASKVTIQYAWEGAISYGMPTMPSTWSSTPSSLSSGIANNAVLVLLVTSENGVNQAYYGTKITLQ
jgi:hypothetical protein